MTDEPDKPKRRPRPRRTTRGSMAAAASRGAPTPQAVPQAVPLPDFPAPPPETSTGVRESRTPARPKPRLTPVKMTFELDPDQVRRVKAWAGRRVVSAATVVRALLGELVHDAATGARIADRLPHAPAPASPTATTFDVPPDLYGDVRAWVAEHDTTAAAVLRLLLAELFTGRAGLPARVEARIADGSATRR